MAKLHVINRKGVETTVDGQAGLSVMEVLREAGFEEVTALCGGHLSCATCHIYVDPVFAEKVTEMRGDENDLLDGSEYRDSRSRLACQIRFEEMVDGLRVTIAPED